MCVKVGDEVKGGDIYATTPETDLIVHKCMVSPLISGKVVDVVSDGEYTINDVIMKIEDEDVYKRQIFYGGAVVRQLEKMCIKYFVSSKN